MHCPLQAIAVTWGGLNLDLVEYKATFKLRSTEEVRGYSELCVDHVRLVNACVHVRLVVKLLVTSTGLDKVCIMRWIR
jgi:hypothetical protein